MTKGCLPADRVGDCMCQDWIDSSVHRLPGPEKCSPAIGYFYTFSVGESPLRDPVDPARMTLSLRLGLPQLCLHEILLQDLTGRKQATSNEQWIAIALARTMTMLWYTVSWNGMIHV